MKKSLLTWLKEERKSEPTQYSEYQELLGLYIALAFFILLIRSF